MGAYYWYVKIPQYGYMEHGKNIILLYVKKHMAPRALCYNFPLVRDKPLGAPAFARLIYCNYMEKIDSIVTVPHKFLFANKSCPYSMVLLQCVKHYPIVVCSQRADRPGAFRKSVWALKSKSFYNVKAA